MKYRFSWALVALMVVGVQAGAAEKGKDKPNDGGFSAMDVNKNGKVSKTEFLDAERKKADEMNRGFNADQAKKRFEKKDKDQDGFLTKEEVAGVQAGEKDKAEEEKKDSGFAAIDNNTDGKISKKEYVNFQKKAAKEAGKDFDSDMAKGEFEFMDTNADGFLSKAEMNPKAKHDMPKEEDPDKANQA